MEDPYAPAGEGPILYVTESSLPCQTARLALAEKGVAYRLRHVNLNTLEQARWRPRYLARLRELRDRRVRQALRPRRPL